MSILAGTDAGTYLNGFGGLVDELEQYVDLGASSHSALVSATAAGDRVAGKPIGRIEAGWAGDLVLVESNPDDHISPCARCMRWLPTAPWSTCAGSTKPSPDTYPEARGA